MSNYEIEKHFACFHTVMETRVEVWENEKLFIYPAIFIEYWYNQRQTKHYYYGSTENQVI